MSYFDFNTAERQTSMKLIPHGTPAMVVMTVRPGGVGDGGWLKANRDGSCQMLDLEFTIDGGEFNKRKFWTLFVVEGQTEGQKTAADISRSKLRGIVEAARGINPTDASDAAVAARRIAGWGDLNGLRFPCRIAVEKGKTNQLTGERFDDKNVFGEAITPDDADYVHPGQQQTVPAAGGFAQAPAQTPQAANAAPVQKPAWAA